MKKIIEYFYIFSKLSLSFGLLICLIGMSYILYLNYKNEEDISQIRSFSEEKLNNNINKNSLLIEDTLIPLSSANRESIKERLSTA